LIVGVIIGPLAILATALAIFLFRRSRRSGSSSWSSQADINDKSIDFVSRIDETTLVTYANDVVTYEGGPTNARAPASVFTVQPFEALYAV
jgi:hypothetical protein